MSGHSTIAVPASGPTVVRRPGHVLPTGMGHPPHVGAEAVSGDGRKLPQPTTGWRHLPRAFGFPLLAIVLRLTPGPPGDIGYLLLAGHALLGRRQAVLSLVLLWLFNGATHAFARPPGLAPLYRHLVVIAAAASVLALHRGGMPRASNPGIRLFTAALSLLLLCHSLLASVVPDVSFLKALSFALAIQTLLVAWSSLKTADRALLNMQTWGLLGGIALLSLPLYLMGRGFERNGTGFQGWLVHPQTFGPTMAILATHSIMDWLTRRKVSMSAILIAVLAVAWVYFSRARIGGLQLVAGVATGIVCGPLTGTFTRFAKDGRMRASRVALLAVPLTVAIAVLGARLPALVDDFVNKGKTDTQTITEAALRSRGFLIDRMLANIAERPLTGVGLGIESDLEESSRTFREPIFGLPLGASVEKGVLPVAIVEELGWPLATLFGCWFTVLFAMAVRGGPTAAAVFVAALSVNVAEACFFSPGGSGLLVMVIVAMTVTEASARRFDAAPVHRSPLPVVPCPTRHVA